MLYRFADFVLDLHLYELRRGEERIDLQPKVLEVLRYLLENADRSVPKEELLDELWPGVAVGDAVLTRAISQARRALGDADRDEGIIRTVRGRGYRIDVPVDAEDDPAAPQRQDGAERPAIEPPTGMPELEPPLEPEVPGPSEPQAAASPPARRWRTPAAIAGGALVLGALVLLGSPPRETPAPQRNVKPPAPSRSSIAVLPFVNMSEARAKEFIADGFTEEIITTLSRVPSLQVAARTSSFAFKDHAEDVRAIGAQLGVGTVLEGSIRLHGGRMRVTAQLIAVPTGFHLWTEVYERPESDIFGVQEELATRIAGELVEQLGPGAPQRMRAPSTSFEAYQRYLEGRSHWARKTREGYTRASELFEQALELDPSYAPAWAGLSDVYRNTWAYWSTEPRDGPLLARAEESARRALALDPESAEAHVSLASVIQDRYRSWNEADRLFRRALELAPSLAGVHHAYGTFLLIRGRSRAARGEIERALALDPLSPLALTQAGRAAVYDRDPEAAVQRLRRALELNPQDPSAPRLLFIAYDALGEDALAREAYLRVAPRSARLPLRGLARMLGNRFVVARVTDLASRFEGLSPDGPYGIALGLAFSGDEQGMYEFLELAEPKSLHHVRLEPVLDPYRDSPRFVALLERAGYTD